jgi:aminoglycoside phosphotransferase (APT) family kinase protein
MTVAALERYLDEALGDRETITVTPMAGGGSCEVFALDRGTSRWVLRRAPRYLSSATAHDVLREFRILDAIKEEPLAIARPLLACSDPEVFDAPFYVMDRIDGSPIRSCVPEAWGSAPETHGRALEQLIDALVAIHAVDWRGCGLGDMAHGGDYLRQQVARWLAQLESYGGRSLPAAHVVAGWLEDHLPADQSSALFHGDYKLDNVLFAPEAPPKLLAVVDWEMAAVGDPLVDLAWALIFHPGQEGTMPLGMAREPTFAVDRLPSGRDLVDRYARRSGRDVSMMGWYDVFARWKLAIVLEGSYDKFLGGRSTNPVHEFFGCQVDLLLDGAVTITELGDPA